MDDVTKLPDVLDTTPIESSCSKQPLKPDPLDGRFWKSTVSHALYFNLSMQLIEFLFEFPDKSLKLTSGNCLGSAHRQYWCFKNWFRYPVDPSGVADHDWRNLVQTTTLADMIEERPDGA
jgi:hypothetical protein